MKYIKLVVIFLFCVSGQAVAAKRDIVAERMREHAQKERAIHNKNPVPHKNPKPAKKTPAKPKPKPAPKEDKKDDKKKDDKKKDDKKKDDKKKDEEKSSGGGGSKSSSKDENIDKKEEAKKEEEKKGKKSEGKKAEKKERPPIYFIPDPRDQVEPVSLNEEQNSKIDQLMQKESVAEAKALYHESNAAPRVKDVNGVDQIECHGLSKGAAAVQLVAYLENKGDKKPFLVNADDETHEYLNSFIQKHCQHLWVADAGEKMELSYKGSMVGHAVKYPGGKSYAKDSLEQMICMRVLDGKKVPVQFKVVKDQQNKPIIQAHFKEAADAESLAAYVEGEVVKDTKSYYVTLKEGASKRILPAESADYYVKVAESLARNQELT